MKNIKIIGLILFSVAVLTALAVLLFLNFDLKLEKNLTKIAPFFNIQTSPPPTTEISATSTENIIYLATAPDGNFYLYARFFPFYYPEGREYEVLHELIGYSTSTLPSNFSLEPIIEIPSRASLFPESVIALQDGKILFAIVFPFKYSVSSDANKSSLPPDTDFFIYDPVGKVLDYKFSPSIGGYPYNGSLSKDGNYVAYTNMCITCEPVPLTELLVNIKKSSYMKISPVSSFEWLEKGRYRFKDLVERECGMEELGPVPCYKEASELPWKYGTF